MNLNDPKTRRAELDRALVAQHGPLRPIMILALALATALVAGPGRANPSNKERAQKHFKAGLLLLETDNIKVATQEFESSVALYPTKNGYFNLATCYFALKRYNDAKVAIQRLKSAFKDNLDEEWQAEIARFEEKLENEIVPVGFSINVPDARIDLNGRDVTEEMKSGTIYVDPGEHTVTISADEFRTITEVIKVASGQGRTVFRFVMVNSAEGGAGPGNQTDPALQQSTTHPVHFKNEDNGRRREKRPRIGTAIAFSIGGLAGLAAITTGVIHMSGVADIRNDCDAYDMCNPVVKDEVESMLKLGVATNVLISVAAVGFVAGTILAFVEGRSSKKERVSVAPSLWQDGGGLSISKTF